MHIQVYRILHLGCKQAHTSNFLEGKKEKKMVTKKQPCITKHIMLRKKKLATFMKLFPKKAHKTTKTSLYLSGKKSIVHNKS